MHGLGLRTGFHCAGWLIDFIPLPVISGFTSAAAITIGMGQMKVSTCIGYGTVGTLPCVLLVMCIWYGNP